MTKFGYCICFALRSIARSAAARALSWSREEDGVRIMVCSGMGMLAALSLAALLSYPARAQDAPALPWWEACTAMVPAGPYLVCEPAAIDWNLVQTEGDVLTACSHVLAYAVTHDDDVGTVAWSVCRDVFPGMTPADSYWWETCQHAVAGWYVVCDPATIDWDLVQTPVDFKAACAHAAAYAVAVGEIDGVSWQICRQWLPYNPEQPFVPGH